jgi:hypothetical protein
MRKLTVALSAVLVGAAVAPAMADVTYTPVTGAIPDFGRIGLYNPAAPGTINTVYVDGAEQSDTLTFTFAILMKDWSWYVDRLHFSFAYDNSVMEVYDAHALGGFDANNYDPFAGTGGWPNSSEDPQVVASLSQYMLQESDYVTIYDEEVFPFFQVVLHVKSDTYSQVGEFGIVLDPYLPPYYGMTMESHSFTTSFVPDEFDYYGGAIHEIPEPSSMLLLGAVAAAGVGIIRRRRVI